MARILPLPKGVGKKLYAEAMKPLDLFDRPTAWSLMRKNGPLMAEAFKKNGAAVLDAVRRHGKDAEVAIARHKNALALYKVHGSVVFPFLSKLDPKLMDRVGSISTYTPESNARVWNLYQAFLRVPLERVESLLSSTPEERLDAALADLVGNRGKRIPRS